CIRTVWFILPVGGRRGHSRRWHQEYEFIGLPLLQRVSRILEYGLRQGERLIINQIVKVALVPQRRIGTKRRDQGKSLYHRISDAGAVEFVVEKIKLRCHVSDAAPIGSQVFFEA